MRPEPAAVVSPLIAFIIASPIVLFGDGRAQGGILLMVAGFLPLFLSGLTVLLYLVLSKLTKGSFAIYALAGIFLGTLCGTLCFLAGGGGVVASVFSFIWPCASLIVFRLLIKGQVGRFCGTTE